MKYLSILLLFLFSTPVYAQTNPGFVDGLTLCATVTSVYCQGNPPFNSLGLNQAFSNKADFPFANSNFAGVEPITVTFPANIVTIGFDYSHVGTFTALQTLNGGVAGVLPQPNWSTLSILYQPAFFNLGGLPVGSMDAHLAGAIGLPEALGGAIDVPSSFTGTFVSAGVAGYARTSSTTAPAVGLFGVGMANAANTNNWGLNTICSNTGVTVPATQTGLNGVTCYSIEADVNVMKTSGGGTPTGTVRGIAIFGGSEVVPTGGAYALEIGPFSQSNTNGVPWSGAIIIDDAPNVFGIRLGASASATNGVNSQSMQWRSVSSGGTSYIGNIFADQNGNITIQPDNAGGKSLIVNAGTATAVIETSATALNVFQPLIMFGATSGATSLVAASVASGSINIPAASGTIAVSASSPIAVNATTGNITCSTCALTSSTITLGSTAMALGSTNTTIAGAITWSGIQTVSNNTASSSISTGSFITSGGLGVAKTSTFGDTINISTSSQFHGFVLSNGSNNIVTFLGLSASNDDGTLQLLTGGVANMQFTANTSTANFINNGQGLTLGSTSAAGAGNLTATGTVRANTGFNINGTAGTSCTLTTVSHLTVVNGIVTLCN